MNGVCLLPSLNRAKLLERFFESYKDTESEVPVWVLVDKTDPQKEDYLKLTLPKGSILILTEAITMGDKVREVWDRFIDMDFIMLVNDDHILKTKHWDELVIQRVTGTNVVSTNDGWMGAARICGATCWSGQVLRTVGYMFPEGLQHLYVDNVWEFLCGKTGSCQIIMDVLVEHDHAFRNGVKDYTHYKVYPEGWQNPTPGSDTFYYQKWLSENAEKDATKLMSIQPKQGLMVATPSQDGKTSMCYTLGLVDTTLFMSQQNVHFEMARVEGSSLLPHARNSLVDMFLKSKCQKFLFVDSDQGFDRSTAITLYRSNRKIIAAVTPHKRFPVNLNFEPLPEHAHYFKDLYNKSEEEYFKYAKECAGFEGEVEVSKAGTGMIMIDRSVFEIMDQHMTKEEEKLATFIKELKENQSIWEKHGELVDTYLPTSFSYQAFDNNPTMLHREFYSMGAVGGKYRGEDWKFCELAKKLYIPTFINSNVVIPHHGSHIYQIGRPPQ